MNDDVEYLKQVYALGDSGETKKLYGDWAESYDDELRANNYASPMRTASALAATVSNRNAPLLDIGCGTGLSGEALREAGFPVVDGTDFSEEMLAVSEAKNVYRAVIKADFSDPMPVERGAYANAAAVGVFSPGHAEPEEVASFLSILPKGGCFGFTLNDHALAEGGYVEAIESLVDAGKVEIAFEDYGDHLPEIGLKSKVQVLRVL